MAGCGGGTRQDEDEPRGEFPVEVVSAEFPQEQKLAKDSKMEIVVRNAGSKEIPVISVTVECPGQKRDENETGNEAEGGADSSASGGSPSGAGSQGGGFNYQTTFPGVADPSRPQFVVNTIPTRTPRNYDRGRLDPLERSSSYVSTFPLGKLAPGREVTFAWDVTAVKAGPYKICWKVNAGLDGKAKAVPHQGTPIAGEFTGTVSDVAPDARIGEDGRTVIESEPEPPTGE
ncbi:MAG TPA: hypothetical protein VHF45_10325 [Thermoleophilaceae bacterium]|nr:hypothetical protein [Thermoleophilaceae bacterium]